MTNQNKLFVWVGSLLVVIVVLVFIIFLLVNRRAENASLGTVPSASSQTTSQVSSSPSEQTKTTTQTDAFSKQYGSSCDKSANPTFTNSVLALDKIGGIEPLGKVSDGHVTPVDHVYVAPISQSVADNTYDIVMPADGRVVSVGRMPAQYIGDKTDITLPPDDFRLVISFNCRYYAILIHVHKLSDPVAAAAGTVKPGENKQLSLALKAGDLLAHLGGNPFDLTMVDTQTTLPGFVTPSLYQSEPWKIHTIDPFSVYTGELKKGLEAKSLRTVEPFGGKLDWDKKGTLIGSWFKQGTNGYQGATPDRYWDGHLSIAPNHIDPSGVIYSTGNWQGKAAQYLIKGDFKPEDVTAGSGVVKIELSDMSYKLADGSPFTGGVYKRGMQLDKTNGQVVGVVLLQVQAGEKLKVEQFPGKTAAEVTAFTSNAALYER